MTAEEWENYTPGYVSALAVMTPRRLRLLAAALCRHFARLLHYDGVATAIEAIEHFADTGKSQAALRRTRQAIQELRNRPRDEDAHLSADPVFALFIVHVAASENAYTHTLRTAVEVHQQIDGLSEMGAWRLLFHPVRFFIPYPFRPAAFDPRWRNETAVALATGIYDGRHFDRLPILADALEDAGCDAVELLAHLRGPGPHARGCWPLDLVLGKS